MDKNDDNHDDVQTRKIEEELLKELNDLEGVYSSSSSLSPLSVASSTLFAIEGLHNDNDGDSGDGERLESTKVNENILCSIPGFELFKETSGLTSTVCNKAKEVIDSIKEVYGEDIIQSISIDDKPDQKNHNTDPNAALEEDQSYVHDEEQGKAKSFALEKNHSNDESSVSEVETETESANHEGNINHENMTTPKEDSKEVTKKHSITTSSNFITSIIPSTTSLLFEDSSLQLFEDLQKKTELEAKKEQQELQQRLLKDREKRIMDASREREVWLKQDKSSKIIQVALQEFCRRRKSRRLRSLCKGSFWCDHLEVYWLLKNAFHTMYIFTLETRVAITLQVIFRKYLGRKKSRQKVMIQAMDNLVNRIVLRKSVFFWKIVISTMKMEERMMKELLNSTLRIQCAYRMYKAKQISNERKERYSKAVAIQKRYRGYKAHQRYQIERVKMQNTIRATILIQSFYRGHVTRRRLDHVVSTNYSYMDNDVDSILGQEADLLLNEIHTMEDNDQSTKEWVPSKPLYHFVPNEIKTMSNKRSIIPNYQGQQLIESAKDQNVDRSQVKSTTNEIGTDDIDSSTNAVDGKNKDNNSLMKEWNLNDSRVIEVSA